MRLVDFIGVLRRYQDKPSGYTVALVVLAVALGVRELLDPYIKIPYVTLFPAMVICSLVGLPASWPPSLAASLPGICGCRPGERLHWSGRSVLSRFSFTY
jgi:hypothetical protein